MAYGRLDVFWPDGQFKTFALVDNTISIGRSTGNTIVLETNAISRYHLSIQHDGRDVQVTDLESANGSFIDGERMGVNQPRLLEDGSEITIGDLRLIFHRLDEQPTQPIKYVDDTTTRRVEAIAPTFRLDVIGPAQGFSPGASMSAEIRITNNSPGEQRFRLSVTGMPPEWIRIDRPEVVVASNQSETVLVNFRPARRSDSPPGDYSALVRVWPKERPDARLEATLLVRILAFSGFGLALEKAHLTAGQPLRLYVHNQGSAPLPVSITGFERSGKLRFTLSANQVTLAPGARQIIQGEVKPARRKLLGKPVNHTFDMQVRSQNAARFLTVARGHYVQTPVLPGWAAGALAALIVVSFIIIALIAAALLQPRPPQIDSFTLSASRIAQGQPLTLNWSGLNINRLQLFINDVASLTTLDPAIGSANLDTSSLEGPVELRLVASGSGQSVEANQMVEVYAPVSEIRFTVTPTQVTRFVVQSLTIEWEAPGAVTTRLSGLESFSSAPLQTDFGPEEQLRDVVGIALGPLRLTLIAEDSAGQTTTRTLDIPVVDPQCQPAGAAVTLHLGPDARHQVVGTIPQGVLVTVDAQDSTGQWLRAQLAGGITGWGSLGQMACAPGFNPADLRKELNVPLLPTPTLPPPPTLTPLPTLPPTPRTPVTLTPAPAFAGTPAPFSASSPTPPTPTASG